AFSSSPFPFREGAGGLGSAPQPHPRPLPEAGRGDIPTLPPPSRSGKGAGGLGSFFRRVMHLMKPLPLSLIAAFGLAAFVLTAGVGRSVPVVMRVAADEGSADFAGLQLQGVGSCSAASCHGYNGPKGSKGSEYTTWVTHDPHARAYSVLFEV